MVHRISVIPHCDDGVCLCGCAVGISCCVGSNGGIAFCDVDCRVISSGEGRVGFVEIGDCSCNGDAVRVCSISN